MAELTVLVEMGGRKVEMRRPTDGALVVLARVSRGIPEVKIENVEELPQEVRDRLVRNLGTIGKIVEQLVVQDADKDWLDDAMILGTVTAEDVFRAIREVGEKFNGKSAPPAKKAAVRRAARPR